MRDGSQKAVGQFIIDGIFYAYSLFIWNKFMVMAPVLVGPLFLKICETTIPFDLGASRPPLQGNATYGRHGIVDDHSFKNLSIGMVRQSNELHVCRCDPGKVRRRREKSPGRFDVATKLLFPIQLIPHRPE